MNLLRRTSTAKVVDLDENEQKQLAMQRRRSSIAITQYDDEPILPNAIKPTIEVFPKSTSQRQETLLISPDPRVKGFTITCARTGKHFLTVVTPPTSLPGSSHTKHFFGALNTPWKSGSHRGSDSSNSDNDNSDNSKKLCTLDRDALSFRKRHNVQDPYTNRELIAMEFNHSSWDGGSLKASIELMNKYSDNGTMEPVNMKWKGKRASLEGVLEVGQRPAAVCAKGFETEAGEYALYVAPGMDLYVCAITVMAVDDRVRRGSGDSPFTPELNRITSYGFGKKNDTSVQRD